MDWLLNPIMNGVACLLLSLGSFFFTEALRRWLYLFKTRELHPSIEEELDAAFRADAVKSRKEKYLAAGWNEEIPGVFIKPGDNSAGEKDNRTFTESGKEKPVASEEYKKVYNSGLGINQANSSEHAVH